MPEQFYTQELPNGMTLLAQPMESVSSAALSLVVRCGAAYDATDAAGAASVAAEWLMRGAGDRSESGADAQAYRLR